MPKTPFMGGIEGFGGLLLPTAIFLFFWVSLGLCLARGVHVFLFY